MIEQNNIQRLANTVARRAGHARATKIVFGKVKEGKVISHTKYGYRKKTTGEYVAKSYVMHHWGIKNCYYQHAETIVMLPEPRNLRMIRLN